MEFFSEDLHSDSGDESDGRIMVLVCLYTVILYPEETRDTEFIVVANATTDSMKVVMESLTLVTQTKTKEKSFAVGADFAGGANFQVITIFDFFKFCYNTPNNLG